MESRGLSADSSHECNKSNDSDNSSENSDGELGALFRDAHEGDDGEKQDTFYFVGITISYEGSSEDGIDTIADSAIHTSSKVCFEYSYNRKIPIMSYLIVPGIVQIENKQHFNVLISIGLCILPWYWMGYASKR